MNVTKEQFTAEIMRRKQERAAERDAKRAIDEAIETRYVSTYLFSNMSCTKYRGKYRTPKGYEC